MPLQGGCGMAIAQPSERLRARERALAKPEWGLKHTCQHCGALFYDMRKSPPTCPKCGAEQEVEKPRARRGAAAAAAAEPVRAAVVPKPVVAEEEAELEVEDATLETDEDEEAEEFLEDASDIGEDEDDVAGVLDGVVEGEEKE
jgi:uncharacterized protein (TIGR02300 family)